MYEDTSPPEHDEPAPPPGADRREPLFSAPVSVVMLGVVLVGIHGLTQLLDEAGRDQVLFDYALIPQRFWAGQGSPDAYPNLAAKLLTLLSTGFLHVNWLHVLVNTGMLLAFGAQTQRLIGQGVQATALFLALFAVSIIAGSIALAAFGPSGPAAVGASGGVSGLMGAVFAIGLDGRPDLASRRFLGVTLAFFLSNAALWLVGPALAGSGIAWQAHLGGYAAGAVMMALLPRHPLVENPI